MLPTTSRLIRSHPVWSGNAKQAERIAQNDSGRPSEQEPGVLRRLTLGRTDRAGVVIPPVYDRGQLVEVGDDSMGLPLARCSLRYFGKHRELLEQLDVLRSRESGEIEVAAYRLG
jgi:hypothetical protein